MNENENKNRNNIYGVVSRLVLDQATMKIFRDRDIAFYEKLKAFPQKMKDYYQQYQKWKEESPVYKEYQETQEKEEDLRCSRKTLKVWLDANSEKKVGGPKWKKKQKEYDRLEEKVEQARVKKKTEFDRMLQAIQSEVEVPSDPIAALDLLSPAPDPRRKNIYNLFGRPEDINVPYDKELGRLADYVILTILHDRKLKKERTKPINNGIWPEKEEWAESLWGELQSDNPEIITEVNLCLDRVKEDLLAQQGSNKANKRNPQDPPTGEKPANNVYEHSPDYRNVTWYGKNYTFKKNQATAIKLLWQAHEDPQKVGVHEAEIGKALDTISVKYRLIQTFRQRCKGKRGLNPAWKEIIEHMGSGVYRLIIPKQDKAKSS